MSSLDSLPNRVSIPQDVPKPAIGEDRLERFRDAFSLAEYENYVCNRAAIRLELVREGLMK